MTGVRISGLPTLPSSTSNELFVIVQNGVTYRGSLDQLTQFETLEYECTLATTGALTVTYNNGSSGAGATLVNAGSLAALSIDGTVVSLGNVILVKNQSSSLQNGIYTVTVVGDGATAWVLTRSVYYDEAAQIIQGNCFTVGSGTVNGLTQWIQTAVVNTIGTDAITFQSNVIAGTGITKTNNTISTSVVTASGTYTPTLTNVANLSASTAYLCQYLRVGSTVTVSGQADIMPTSASVSTELGISLPIASVLTNAPNCSGTACSSTEVSESAAILGDTTNHRAQMTLITTTTANHPMYFSFTYQII